MVLFLSHLKNENDKPTNATMATKTVNVSKIMNHCQRTHTHTYICIISIWISSKNWETSDLPGITSHQPNRIKHTFSFGISIRLFFLFLYYVIYSIGLINRIKWKYVSCPSINEHTSFCLDCYRESLLWDAQLSSKMPK